MLSNFKKLSLYNPYSDLVSYFVPLLLVFMFGYYAGYSFINIIFKLSSNFHFLINICLIVIILSVIGKILYEATSYIVTLIYIILFKAGSSLKEKGRLLSFLGRIMLCFVPTVKSREIPTVMLLEYFKDNCLTRIWYAKTYMYTRLIQTTLGALLISSWLYTEHRSTLIILTIACLIMTFSARLRLLHAEREIENMIFNK